MTNEISIDQQGSRTICGDVAHRLAFDAPDQLPSYKCSANNFYVVEQPIEGSHNWEIRAGQTTREGAMQYMQSGRVLVDVTNAPKSYLDVIDRDLTVKQ